MELYLKSTIGSLVTDGHTNAWQYISATIKHTD